MYLLRYFYELKTKEPITYQELQAWTHFSGVDLSLEEIQIIRRIDSEFTVLINNASTSS